MSGLEFKRGSNIKQFCPLTIGKQEQINKVGASYLACYYWSLYEFYIHIFEFHMLMYYWKILFLSNYKASVRQCSFNVAGKNTQENSIAEAVYKSMKFKSLIFNFLVCAY